MYRPEKFSDFIGNKRQVQFILDHIKRKTLPNFLIISGPIGTGKTTLVKLTALALNCKGITVPCYNCASCKKIIKSVIQKNEDTDNVISRKMTTDGTKEKASEIVELIKPSLMSSDKRIIILDEAHQMHESSQDAILVDTEYLAENVYVFLITSDITLIKESVLSRATHLTLNPLSKTDLTRLLNMEVKRRKLALENESMIFNILTTWSENKPRKALKVLEAMGENKTVSLSDISAFVTYIETASLIPILSSFRGDILIGIDAITKINIDANTKVFIVDFLIETLKAMRGATLSSMSAKDASIVREATNKVDLKVIMQFLGEVSRIEKLDKTTLLGAFLKVHPSLSFIPERKMEAVELDTLKLSRVSATVPMHQQSFAEIPTLEGLLSQGTVYEDSKEIDILENDENEND